MYEYNVRILRVVDGDTVDVDIDLGFGMIYKKQRVRLHGIDTPESRTRDKEEKKYGKAAKAHLELLLTDKVRMLCHDKGKFGRILGDFFIEAEGKLLTEVMIDEGHAVPYHGGSKDETQAAHMANRERLVAEGVVVLEDTSK